MWILRQFRHAISLQQLNDTYTYSDSLFGSFVHLVRDLRRIVQKFWAKNPSTDVSYPKSEHVDFPEFTVCNGFATAARHINIP